MISILASLFLEHTVYMTVYDLVIAHYTSGTARGRLDKDLICRFYMKLLTDRQTNRKTVKCRVKHNLFGGGN